MQDRDDEPRFSERFNMQVPTGFGHALSELAAIRHQKKSELVRQTLLRELEANGVQLLEPERRATA